MGATLLEVLVACAIFSILIIICFALMRYGSRSWKSIETRMDAEKSVQQTKNILRAELSRSSWSTVVIYQEPNDYRHAICFKSALDAANINYFTEVDTGRPSWRKYLLFYSAKPGALKYHDGIACAAETGRDDGAVKDLKCPHKWIIRKEISLDAPVTSSPSSLLPFITAPQNMESLMSPETHVLGARLVAQNILGFSVRKAETPSVRDVNVMLKIFKTKEASSTMTIGVGNLSDSPFTVQVNLDIIPLN